MKWKLLEWILKSIVIQGNQDTEIKRLYQLIFKVHQEEFTEDNNHILKAFIYESITKALK